VIRRAGHADEEVLLELIKEFYEVDGHEFHPVTVKGGLSPLLTSDRYGVVLLAKDPDPVGYAVLVWSYSIESGGRDALLDEIYVRTPGEGIGRALMDEVFEEMRRQGLRRIFLETEAENEQARAFYRSIGFNAEDSIWMTADIG
jgi:GNAT superfamily N-acetyltransferase